MSEITVTASVSLAIEFTNALLHNNVEGWFGARNQLRDTFDSLIDADDPSVDEEDRKKIKLSILKTLACFSQTLQYKRVTKIVPSFVPSDHELVPDRAIIFHVGTDSSPSSIIFAVYLQKDNNDETDTWSGWSLKRYPTLVCLEHPESKFKDVIILGDD